MELVHVGFSWLCSYNILRTTYVQVYNLRIDILVCCLKTVCI